MVWALETATKKTVGASPSEALFSPNFVKITDLFLFISLIRLLFYVRMNPSLAFHGTNPPEAHFPTVYSLQKHCFMNWAICFSLIQCSLKWQGKKQNNMQMLYKGLINLRQSSSQFIVLFIPSPTPWSPILKQAKADYLHSHIHYTLLSAITGLVRCAGLPLPLF